MKNLLTKAAVGLSMLALPLSSYAQLKPPASDPNLQAVGTKLGTTASASLPTLVGNMINVILSVMGIVFVLLIVYAGILYMQGGTDEKKIAKAKNLIINAIIGLVIVIAAFAISSFIITQLIAVSAS